MGNSRHSCAGRERISNTGQVTDMDNTDKEIDHDSAEAGNCHTDSIQSSRASRERGQKKKQKVLRFSGYHDRKG